jgi:LmbE family N-acetylglucosaminyl deacetylase
MLTNHINTVLVLAPHTDDGELGCGGTIAKFIEQHIRVVCVAFSIAEDSVPQGFEKDALIQEFEQAMLTLGLQKEDILYHKFKVRQFPQFRQEILQKLIELRQLYKPDLVFVPSLNDIHQDHQVIANEGVRAFKKTPILGYEMPWNNLIFETRCFVKLNEGHIHKKIKALNCYDTQKHRPYLNEKFIWSLAITRGTQFESDYAEAFEVIRWVL